MGECGLHWDQGPARKAGGQGMSGQGYSSIACQWQAAMA